VRARRRLVMASSTEGSSSLLVALSSKADPVSGSRPLAAPVSGAAETGRGLPGMVQQSSGLSTAPPNAATSGHSAEADGPASAAPSIQHGRQSGTAMTARSLRACGLRRRGCRGKADGVYDATSK
jgi:hypothetical protein